MPYRKSPLVEGEVYHVCTKSISNFEIFNTDKEYERMIEAIVFYKIENPPCKFCEISKPALELVNSNAGLEVGVGRLVRILAYCIMPTHIHLLLQQLKEHGISKFMNLILKSYSRYFNIKHKRKGPLWESRFKNILVKNDEQLLHLTRYIHLNPVTALLVDNPKDWKFSSHREYVDLIEKDKKICDFHDYFDMNPYAYQKFVEDRISYQRELARIKELILD